MKGWFSWSIICLSSISIIYICLSAYLPIIYQSIYDASICLSSLYPSIYLSIICHLSSIYIISVCLSVYLTYLIFTFPCVVRHTDSLPLQDKPSVRAHNHLLSRSLLSWFTSDSPSSCSSRPTSTSTHPSPDTHWRSC